MGLCVRFHSPKSPTHKKAWAIAWVTEADQLSCTTIRALHMHTHLPQSSCAPDRPTITARRAPLLLVGIRLFPLRFLRFHANNAIVCLRCLLCVAYVGWHAFAVYGCDTKIFSRIFSANSMRFVSTLEFFLLLVVASPSFRAPLAERIQTHMPADVYVVQKIAPLFHFPALSPARPLSLSLSCCVLVHILVGRPILSTTILFMFHFFSKLYSIPYFFLIKQYKL